MWKNGIFNILDLLISVSISTKSGNWTTSRCGRSHRRWRSCTSKICTGWSFRPSTSSAARLPIGFWYAWSSVEYPVTRQAPAVPVEAGMNPWRQGPYPSTSMPVVVPGQRKTCPIPPGPRIAPHDPWLFAESCHVPHRDVAATHSWLLNSLCARKRPTFWSLRLL